MEAIHVLVQLAAWAVIALIILSAVVQPLLGRLLLRRPTPRTTSSCFPREPPPSPSPAWSLAFLVDVDEDAGLFRPSVQLRGSPLPLGASIRLELVDEGGVRLANRRSLPPWAIGTELPLPAFSLPAGAGLTEVLGWHWDVVIEDERGEKARWREHPGPAGSLNPEAELDGVALRSLF
jgi:hypothetical protein